jgi:hypothetical protein
VSWPGKKGECCFSKYDRPCHIESRLERLERLVHTLAEGDRVREI